MPSPVGHSLAALVVHQSQPGRVQSWKSLFLFVLIAHAPDLDFIPGFLIGDPNRFHHGFTHTFLSGALFALIVSAVGSKLDLRIKPISLFGLVFALYSSHLILDYLCVDTSTPRGQPLLWPFSSSYYLSPVPIFNDIQRDVASNRSFLTSLFSLHNLGTVALETLVMGPVVLGVRWWRTSRQEGK